MLGIHRGGARIPSIFSQALAGTALPYKTNPDHSRTTSTSLPEFSGNPSQTLLLDFRNDPDQQRSRRKSRFSPLENLMLSHWSAEDGDVMCGFPFSFHAEQARFDKFSKMTLRFLLVKVKSYCIVCGGHRPFRR